MEEDVRQALGIDVVGLFNPADMKNGVNNLTPLEDFKDSFPLLNEADCEYLRREADRLYNSTDCACWAHWADAAWATWPTFLPQTKSSRGASAALKTG